MIASGAIFQLYDKYMTPGAFDVEAISPIEIERRERETKSSRLHPAVLQDSAGIAMVEKPPSIPADLLS